MPDKVYRLALNDQPVDAEFYGDVVSLTVEENTHTAGLARLHLAVHMLEDGSWTHLDDGQLELFTKLSVQIGFSGGTGSDGLVAVFDGYITDVDVSLGSQPGGSFLDVTALDSSVLLSLEEKIATWPNLADSDIIQQVLTGYGLQAQVDPTPTVHQENDTTIVQRATDIQFVRELAARNGLELYFESAEAGQVTAYCRAPQLDGSPQPDLAIQFGGESNLRSLTAHLSGRRPLNVKTIQTDVKANSPNVAQAGEGQWAKLGDKDLAALAASTLDGLVTPQDAQAQMLILGPPTGDATELQTHAQAVRDEAAWFIVASGEVNAEAYRTVLRPHRLVLIKGASTAHSGKYYVTRVVHQIQTDGTYTQTFEARRNARDLDGSEQFGGNGLGVALPG